MLNQLLESQAAPQRKPLGTTVSIVLHVVLAAAALRFTHRDAVALPKPDEVVVRHEARPDEPKPMHEAKPATARHNTTSYHGFQLVIAPVVIPIDIPPVDLGAAATDPADFTGTLAPGGRGDGDPNGAPGTSAGADAPHFDFQVDKVAAALPSSARPAYPEMLKASGVEGEALVQFVVDTLGRAEPGSFRVLDTSHEAFGTAVRVTLPRMRFLPAEIRGQKVRMVVQQRFAFAMDR
ncbi:MAG: TonB family protein [Gemmatimonadota bacterium]